MRSGRLRHDDYPVLEWCLGKVVGKASRRGNLYPTKQRPDEKIHAAVALTMALGRAMVEYGGLRASLTIRSSDSRYASRRATRRKAHIERSVSNAR